MASVGRRIIERVKGWYVGRWIPFENDLNDSIIIAGGDYERHWTARVARVVTEFCIREWKFIVMTLVAIALALLKI